MMLQVINLPFSIPHPYQGFATANGIAKASIAGLILEFEVKDCFVGLLRSGIIVVQIPIHQLSYVDLRIK
jgi:hypothetical protein